MIELIIIRRRRIINILYNNINTIFENNIAFIILINNNL